MEQPSRAKTILLVDDEPDVLILVSEVLQGDGYQILTADSGSSGLQISREFEGEIALLLSDFQMPGGMSGMDLATAMTLERPHLKVMLMSVPNWNSCSQRRVAFSSKAVYPVAIACNGGYPHLSRQSIQICRAMKQHGPRI